MNHEPRKRPTVYPSAVDTWIGFMLVMTPITAAAIGTYLLVQGRSADAMLLFLTGALAAVITLAFTLPCRYTVLVDALSMRCGVICYQVPLADIQSVEPSRTIMSGPALSLNRVLVKTAKRQYILSPKERDAFIEDMCSTLNLERPVSG